MVKRAIKIIRPVVDKTVTPCHRRTNPCQVVGHCFLNHLRSRERGSVSVRAAGFAVLTITLACLPALAGKLTVEITGPADQVQFVGGFQRWDSDGNLRRPVNPKARIDAPEVDAVAKKSGPRMWTFDNLPAGRWELVLLLEGKKRIEGWTYAPVLEFDPFFPPTATVADEEDRTWIQEDIRRSRHYENKVEPLAMGGDEKAIRVLMMLLRDLPTSYESEMPGAATLRFEIWQYTWRYGGWVKERRTRVFHRIIMPRDQLRQWTWVWDPKLGNIELTTTPMTIRYELPDLSTRPLPGLYPY